MSYAKTSYVRPHTKASYIRPLSGYNDSKNMPKDSPGKQFVQLKKNGNSCPVEKSALLSNSLKNINDTKDQQIQSLGSAHTKLYDEIEKIQTWTTTVELECKQKNKKLDELTQIVESQRKVVLDLQMQNEKLSLQLTEEIQQRVSILEKFYFSKELCSTIRKKFNDLQGQFDSCHKIKEAIDTCDKEKVKAIENLSKKFETMCADYSEKVVYLNEALKNEKHNILILKDLWDQQNANSEKEHKSFCKLIENYQGELKIFSKDLEDERNKVLGLEYEKSNMLQRISHLEETNEINIKKLRETEETLKLTLNSKLEIEENYASEKEKVNNLNTKCGEIEELRNKQKDEYEENSLALKSTINCLESSLAELKLKLGDMESDNEKLSSKLQLSENERSYLEKEISTMKKERQELKEKLIIDAKIADEITTQLMKEKHTLDMALKDTKDELQEVLLAKEKLGKICLENEEKLSEITNELNTSASKIKELNIIKGKYLETLKIIEEMEAEKQINSELLASKEMRIQELCIIEEKFAEAEKRIKDLESDIVFKNEILVSKNLKIEELNGVEEKYCTILEKDKALENDLQQKLELLTIKDKMVEELNAKLNENAMKLEILEYENIEMKDNLLSERESVKVCLECELMKEKVKEFEDVTKILSDTQEELENQRQRAEHTLKLLSETEDNFDAMRINKEKEIIKFKDSIQSLQHQLRILRVEVRDVEKLRIDNERLQMNIEELILQNTGDFQRLKAENEKLKNEIDVLKTNKNVEDLAKPLSGKKVQQNGRKKQHEDTLSKKQVERSPFQWEEKNGEKMEADSSHDDEVIVLTEGIKNYANHKRFCKDENKKVANIKKTPTVSSSFERRKRAWESESSGSECLEIVFDEEAKKVMGFTPKSKFSSELKKTPNASASGNTMSSQDRKTKRDILPILDQESPNWNQNIKSRTTLSFSTKRSPMIKKPMKTDSSDNVNFLNSRQIIGQENLKDSLCLLKNAETPLTPSTPNRRFFKTPLKEREFSFKKPQLENMWF